jgi:hypothetical protein
VFGPHAAGLGVEAEQLGVVVEHLLEVGDEPLAVDAVAGEAAAEVVVDAAAPHLGEGEEQGLTGLRGDVDRGGAAGLQEDLEAGGVREFGLTAEATPLEVDLRQLVTGDLVEGVWVGEAGVDRDLAAVLVGEAGEVGHALHEVARPARRGRSGGSSTGRRGRAGPG